MNPQELKQLLTDLDACEEAIKWCEGKSLDQAWRECRRSDWMFWLLVNTEIEAGNRELPPTQKQGNLK